jgi:hypothetical protein
MASAPRRVYWDACVWIALIQREKITLPDGTVEDREMMCRTVIKAAKKRSIEILTSAYCLAEVCKEPDGKTNSDKFKDYLETDYIALANVDRFVGERARELMMAAYARIKPRILLQRRSPPMLRRCIHSTSAFLDLMAKSTPRMVAVSKSANQMPGVSRLPYWMQ